jgi:antitoxin CcdA
MIGLAQSLKDARRRLGLTQQQVADELGVSRQAVTHWERGKPIDPDRLPRLSRLLGIELSTVGSRLQEPSGFRERAAGGGKRAVLCRVDAAVLDEAEAHGTDIAALLEHALVADNRTKRTIAWQRANREAIREANAELEQNGLWSDGLRLF